MSKYFIKGNSISVNEYLESIVYGKNFNAYIKEKKSLVKNLRVILSRLGDVEASKATFDDLSYYMDYCDKENIDYLYRLEDLFNLALKYPTLNKEGLKELFDVYNKKLFDKYHLLDHLDNTLDDTLEDDDAYESYIDYVKIESDHAKLKYKEKSKELDDFINPFSKDYVDLLKRVMIENFMEADEVAFRIPAFDIVIDDEEKAKTLSDIYGIKYTPRIYDITEKYLKGFELDEIDDKFFFYDTPEGKNSVNFTKDDYKLTAVREIVMSENASLDNVKTKKLSNR